MHVFINVYMLCFLYSSHIYLLSNCIYLSMAGRKTTIIAVPIPQFPFLQSSLMYHEIVNKLSCLNSNIIIITDYLKYTGTYSIVTVF